MTREDTLTCSEAMTWLRVMSDGEAKKVVAAHLADCVPCRRGERGLARLRRWVSEFRLGTARPDVVALAIAGWCARLP
jgi:hypothetical protein